MSISVCCCALLKSTKYLFVSANDHLPFVIFGLAPSTQNFLVGMPLRLFEQVRMKPSLNHWPVLNPAARFPTGKDGCQTIAELELFVDGF